MNRKLTEREKAFLHELRELMAEYNAMLSVDNDRVCIDVDYSDCEDPVESIILSEAISTSYDLDDFIEQNS